MRRLLVTAGVAGIVVGVATGALTAVLAGLLNVLCSLMHPSPPRKGGS